MLITEDSDAFLPTAALCTAASLRLMGFVS